METQNKPKIMKIVKIVVPSVLVLVVAFGVFWLATAQNRLRDQTMKEIEQQIEECRIKGETRFSKYIPMELRDDEIFLGFIVEKIYEMYNRHEIQKFGDSFVCTMIDNELDEEVIINAVIEGYQKVSSFGEALEIRDNFKYREEIFNRLSMTRSTPMLVEYIEKHGTKPVETTPGKGYYADEKDIHYVNRPGGGPLYDAIYTTYIGDFKVVHYFGTTLNRFYQEEEYSYLTCCFREAILYFDLDFEEYEEIVWTGEYLLFFSENDVLLEYEYLEMID